MKDHYAGVSPGSLPGKGARLLPLPHWVHTPGFALFLFFFWLSATAFFWILAFAPFPPQWDLAQRLRLICFGTTPEGLPALYGWLQLTLSPLAFFFILWLGWSEELKQGFKALLSWRFGQVLLFLTLALTLYGLSQVGERIYRAKFAPEPVLPEHLPDTYPRLDLTLPDLPYTSLEGISHNLRELRGPAILTFIYAHCATICPLLGKIALEGARTLAQKGTPVQVLMLTLDPQRDTLSRLKNLARLWQMEAQPGVTLGRAEEPALRSALEQLNYTLSRDERTGEISHPPLIFLINRKGKVAYILSQPSITWIVEGIERMEEPPPSP